MFSRTISKEQAQKQHDYEEESMSFMGNSDAPPSIGHDCTELLKLVGCEFGFHGAQENFVRLNNVVYEFLEDPDDGYRSHLGAVRITPAKDHTGFFHNPISEVILISTDNKESWPDEWVPPPKDRWTEGPFEGFYFVDTDDFHVWCKIGTEYRDSYYPMFITTYTPKPPPST